MRVLAQRLLAAMRPGETPVSIPNTTVKPRTADGTARERGRAGGCQNQKKKKDEDVPGTGGFDGDSSPKGLRP